MQWRHAVTMQWLKGTLPVPLARDPHGNELLFIPCNPQKQHLYPNFVGYLKFKTRTGVRKQMPVVATSYGYILKNEPGNLYGWGLREALDMLMKHARQAGHQFPTIVP
jgi:hypothetical protein